MRDSTYCHNAIEGPLPAISTGQTSEYKTKLDFGMFFRTTRLSVVLQLRLQREGEILYPH